MRTNLPCHPFTGLLDRGGKAGIGDDLFSAGEAKMGAERDQQISGSGWTDAGDRFEQVPSPLQIRIVVDEIFDALAGRFQLPFERVQDGIKRIDDGSIGSVETVSFNLLHFEDVFDAAQESL